MHVLDGTCAVTGLKQEFDVFSFQANSTLLHLPEVDPISSFPTSSADESTNLQCRLQSICTALRPYQYEGQTQFTGLPLALTMEIAAVYDQYGNIEAISKATRTPVEAIKAWQVAYREQLESAEDPSVRFFNMNGASGEEYMLRRDRDDAQRREIGYMKAKNPKDIRRLIPPFIYRRLLSLKARVASMLLARRKQHQRALLTPQMKNEAVQMIQALGSVKPVAMMLGLDEGMLQVWKESTEISHVAGRYKLN